MQVYCDQSGFMGGWLLVQQRESGLVNFNRNWDEYRLGFGAVDQDGRGDMWLGNAHLHLLTNRSEGSLLRVEMTTTDGQELIAQYGVRVGSEAEGYPLSVWQYEGSAGDALSEAHNGMRFSTPDRDNGAKMKHNCAKLHSGGWWYSASGTSCFQANLNGDYERLSTEFPKNNAIVWHPHMNLKRVRMSVRPATF